MTTTTFRTRLGMAVVAVALAGGLGVAGHADAAPAPADVPTDVSVDDDYWACLALDYVEIGTCLENPLPDLSQYPTVPDIVDDLLGGLPL